MDGRIVVSMKSRHEPAPTDIPTDLEIHMENAVRSVPALEPIRANPRALVRTGRVLTSLIVAFLFVDAIGKLIPLAPYVEGTLKVGYSPELIRPLGLVLAIPALLHVIPRTQFFGAILLTGYFGGAVATHLRTDTPFWLPIAFCVTLWAAYAMRSARLREYILSTIR